MADQTRGMEGEVSGRAGAPPEAGSADDEVRIHLRQIGRVPLLDAGQEATNMKDVWRRYHRRAGPG